MPILESMIATNFKKRWHKIAEATDALKSSNENRLENNTFYWLFMM